MAVAVSPGWRLPELDADELTIAVEAHLRAPPPPVPRAEEPRERRAVPAPRPAPDRPRDRFAAAPAAGSTGFGQAVEGAAAPATLVAASGQPVEIPARETPPAEAWPVDGGVPAGSAHGPGPELIEQDVGEPVVPAAVESGGPGFPTAGRIKFMVMNGPLGEVGRAEFAWLIEGGRYLLRSVAETNGLIGLFKPIRVTQESHGRLTRSGFVPVRFRVQRDGREAETVDFDWDGRRARLYGGGRVTEATLPEGSQDVVSVFYQVAAYPPAAERYQVNVASGRRMYRRSVERVGGQMLDLRIGELKTEFLRVGDPDGERIELWLATQHFNLPVRMRVVNRKGEITEQEVIELEYPGVKLAVEEPSAFSDRAW